MKKHTAQQKNITYNHCRTMNHTHKKNNPWQLDFAEELVKSISLSYMAYDLTTSLWFILLIFLIHILGYCRQSAGPLFCRLVQSESNL